MRGRNDRLSILWGHQICLDRHQFKSFCSCFFSLRLGLCCSRSSLTAIASPCNMFGQCSSCFVDELHLSSQHALLSNTSHYHDDSANISQNPKPGVKPAGIASCARLGLASATHFESTRPLTVSYSCTVRVAGGTSSRNEYGLTFSDQHHHQWRS